MYVTFIEYFNEDDYNEDDVRRIINDHLDHHENSEFADDLYLCRPLDFTNITINEDDDTVTIWLRQSGRDTMGESLNDLITVLDAVDCIDWSKIPCTTHRHGELHG